MKYLTLQNIVIGAGFCLGCLFFSALITMVVYFTTRPNPNVHWWGIFWGGAFGLLIANTILIPALRQRMANRKEAPDPS